MLSGGGGRPNRYNDVEEASNEDEESGSHDSLADRLDFAMDRGGRLAREDCTGEDVGDIRGFEVIEKVYGEDEDKTLAVIKTTTGEQEQQRKLTLIKGRNKE